MKHWIMLVVMAAVMLVGYGWYLDRSDRIKTENEWSGWGVATPEGAIIDSDGRGYTIDLPSDMRDVSGRGEIYDEETACLAIGALHEDIEKLQKAINEYGKFDGQVNCFEGCNIIIGNCETELGIE